MSYKDTVPADVTSTVAVNRADPGMADVSITLDTGNRAGHTVELVSRVNSTDLPLLVMDLYVLVADHLRPTLLDALKDLG